MTPATLRGEAGDAAKTYGTDTPTFGYELSGFINGEDKNVVTGAALCQIAAAVTPRNAGTCPNVVRCASRTLSAANCTFATGRTGALAITKAATPRARLHAPTANMRSLTSVYAIGGNIDTREG